MVAGSEWSTTLLLRGNLKFQIVPNYMILLLILSIVSFGNFSRIIQGTSGSVHQPHLTNIVSVILLKKNGNVQIEPVEIPFCDTKPLGDGRFSASGVVRNQRFSDLPRHQMQWTE